MVPIKKDNIVFIPVDFNMFIENARNKMNEVRYNQECIISESFIDEIIRCIVDSKNTHIIIDLKNVAYGPAHIFWKFEEYLDRIIFCNVAPMMSSRIRNELSELIDVNNDSALLCIDYLSQIAIKAMPNIEYIRTEHLYQIIKSLIVPKEVYLESSGLYSNCYFDIKRLFLNVDELYYSIFTLAETMSVNIREIDALVSSSKNGAILACILAGLFNIKEVHIIGVGPKYAMNIGDSIECIKAGKKYAFIYDFMCTGTEFKIISSLINSKQGILKYAAGIAKFRPETGYNILGVVDALASTNDLNIQYKIYGK